MNDAALGFIIGMQPGVAAGLGTLMLIFGIVMLPLTIIAGISSLCGPPYPYDHRRAAAFDAARPAKVETFASRRPILFWVWIAGRALLWLPPPLFFGAFLISRIFGG